MAISVVPPPISIKATPTSLSSSSNTAELLASGSNTTPFISIVESTS